MHAAAHHLPRPAASVAVICPTGAVRTVAGAPATRPRSPDPVPLTIWIDADAAPRDVKEIVLRAGARLQLAVTLVANQRLQLPGTSPLVNVIRVDGGPDVADRYIVDHAEPGDVVITQDIPLAALLVPKGIAVLDPRGTEHTAETIGERLSVRDFMEHLRSAGEMTGGPPPFDARAKQSFAAGLDRVLTRIRRR